MLWKMTWTKKKLNNVTYGVEDNGYMHYLAQHASYWHLNSL